MTVNGNATYDEAIRASVVQLQAERLNRQKQPLHLIE
jgi:hypothetical protein